MCGLVAWERDKLPGLHKQLLEAVALAKWSKGVDRAQALAIMQQPGELIDEQRRALLDLGARAPPRRWGALRVTLRESLCAAVRDHARSDWRAVVPFLVVAAVWWGIPVLARCGSRGPRPTELIPAESTAE